MRYSDMEYFAKFLIDPEYEDISIQEDWEESISPELLAKEDTLDPGDGIFDDLTDR